MELPEGVEADTLKANIIMECAELEAIFPVPSMMKEAIKYWSKTRIQSWTKIQNALTAEYNPLYNKDGTITEHTESSGETSGEGSGTNTGKVAGMNSEDFNNADQTTSSSTSTGTTSGETDFTRHEYGNIGVTTSQQMLREELDLRAEYDIYALITKEFRDKFCLLVY